jgi:hypothetical protein
LSENKESLAKYYYVEEKKSMDWIADALGVGKTTVSRWLNKIGTIVRGPIYTGGKKNVDEEFFDQYGEKPCYYAGYVNSDGCLYINDGTYSLELVAKIEDRDIIDSFKKDIKSEHDIKVTNSTIRGKTTKAVRLRIGSKKIIFSLMINYGIFPRKSLRESLPRVPKKYRSAVIRGELDGDGSVYPDKERDILQVVFYGSHKKVKKISKIIFKELNIKGSIYNRAIINEKLKNVLLEENIDLDIVDRVVKKLPTSHIYRLDYRNKDDVMKILSWLYNDAQVYLQRKYNLYQEYKLKYEKNKSYQN